MKNDFNFQRRNYFWSNLFYFQKISNQTNFFSKQHFCQQFFFKTIFHLCKFVVSVSTSNSCFASFRKIEKSDIFYIYQLNRMNIAFFSFFIIFFFSWRFFQKKNRSTFSNSRIEFSCFFVYMSCIFSIRDLFVFMFLKYSNRFF